MSWRWGPVFRSNSATITSTPRSSTPWPPTPTSPGMGEAVGWNGEGSDAVPEGLGDAARLPQLQQLRRRPPEVHLLCSSLLFSVPFIKSRLTHQWPPREDEREALLGLGHGDEEHQPDAHVQDCIGLPSLRWE